MKSNMDLPPKNDSNFDLIYPYIKDTKILDIGCGQGYFYDYLKKKKFNGSYIGYDLFKYKNYKFPFYTDLKQIKGKFHHITMVQLIEHLSLKEFEELLDWCKIHLTTDGTITITTVCIENIFNIFWWVRTHVKPYSLPTLIEMMKLCGFKIITAERRYWSRNPFKLLFCFLTGTFSHSRLLMVVRK